MKTDTVRATSAKHTSTMDLVCRRTVLGASDSALGFDYRYVITLPNPRHPQAPTPVIRHHCGDDITRSMAWGYAGAEPSDVALNVLAAYCPCPAPGLGATFVTRDGTVIAARAEQLHQAFKLAFLQRMPTAGGVVTQAQILAWLALQEGVGNAA